ncbi:helix-turn-helix domain-containing protein [Solidesulfovibrio sp.]|uniref:winged helix-turn-helix transcriptional regulator n=1 Tax=Solidesulfovibrio sp. TaxID=2910990 RepID=UPI00262F6E6D|nr:helix-turn-helix domain-containing protein [Solidesulfovibrio sp.]
MTANDADSPEAAARRAGPCPVREVLDRIGDKWSVLVILNLGERGQTRFNELQRAVGGISKRMLSKSLQGLERDGLAARTVQAGRPPAVGYALTDLGQSLREPIAALASWATVHREAVAGARRAYDEAHTDASGAAGCGG